MRDRLYELLLSFLITFALGVAVSGLVLRLWYRYVVGACATDWKLAVILALVVASVTTALEFLATRDPAGGRPR